MRSATTWIRKLFWKDEKVSTDADIDAESRRNHLTKITCYIAFISYLLYCTIYSVIDFQYLWPMIANLAFFSISFLIALFLLRKEKFTSAKILALTSMTISMFIGSGLIGRQTGIHIFFFLISLFPIVIWSFDHRRKIIFFFLLNILCFFYVEYLLPSDRVIIPLPEENLILIRSISYSISFIIIALIILLYQKLAENKEKLLLDANKDLKRKTEELIKLNVTKDKFFSILAHDLKNPFGSVVNGLELLIMKNNNRSEGKFTNIIESLHKTATSTFELLEKLLEWGKIRTRKIHPQFDNININDIVHETIDLYEKAIRDKSLQINIDLEKNLLVYADHYMLSLIVRNLVSNAIKFTPKKGEIKILSEHIDDGRTEIAIVDSGIGISEEDLENLFQIDKTLSSPGTENEMGSGLGLHLCKEYAEQLFGRISVTSKLGEGSRFTISLRKAAE